MCALPFCSDGRVYWNLSFYKAPWKRSTTHKATTFISSKLFLSSFQHCVLGFRLSPGESMALAGLPSKMLAVELAVMVLVLLAMAQQSIQLSLRRPLPEVAKKINGNTVSYLGIVVSSSASEDALLNSGFFVPSTHVPYIDLVGKSFFES